MMPMQNFGVNLGPLLSVVDQSDGVTPVQEKATDTCDPSPPSLFPHKPLFVASLPPLTILVPTDCKSVRSKAQ